MEYRRLEIAKKLATREFMSKGDDVCVDDDLSLDSSLSSLNLKNTSSDVVRNPKYTSIYSNKIERKYVTQVTLKSLPSELEKTMRHPSVTLQTLVQTMRRILKVIYNIIWMSL